jgi:hypothetical protein
MRIRSSTAILLVASLSPSVSGFAPSVSTKGGRRVTHQPEKARQSEFRQKTQLYSDISTEILDYSNERQVGSVRRKRRRSFESSSASSASPFAEFSQTKSVSGRLGLSWSTIQPVLSAALLVTGNTVGASALVLSEVAARPGMAVSSGLFVGEFGRIRCAHKSWRANQGSSGSWKLSVSSSHVFDISYQTFSFLPRSLLNESNFRSSHC